MIGGRRRRKRPGFLELDPVHTCICDGYPCPFCAELTAPDGLGVWACTCGWSGVLVGDGLCPTHPVRSGGHPGIA
jgi:hypothetical protein